MTLGEIRCPFPEVDKAVIERKLQRLTAHLVRCKSSLEELRCFHEALFCETRRVLVGQSTLLKLGSDLTRDAGSKSANHVRPPHRRANRTVSARGALARLVKSTSTLPSRT